MSDTLRDTEFERARAAIAAQKAGALPPVQNVTTTVVISGELESGESVSMEMPIAHPAGIPEPAVVLAAFNKFKEIGGIVVSPDPVTMHFYPAMTLRVVRFELKKVSLVV